MTKFTDEEKEILKEVRRARRQLTREMEGMDSDQKGAYLHELSREFLEGYVKTFQQIAPGGPAVECWVKPKPGTP